MEQNNNIKELELELQVRIAEAEAKKAEEERKTAEEVTKQLEIKTGSIKEILGDNPTPEEKIAAINAIGGNPQNAEATQDLVDHANDKKPAAPNEPVNLKNTKLTVNDKNEEKDELDTKPGFSKWWALPVMASLFFYIGATAKIWSQGKQIKGLNNKIEANQDNTQNLVIKDGEIVLPGKTVQEENGEKVEKKETQKTIEVTVQRGDNLAKILDRLGISYTQDDINKYQDNKWLKKGDKFFITIETVQEKKVIGECGCGEEKNVEIMKLLKICGLDLITPILDKHITYVEQVKQQVKNKKKNHHNHHKHHGGKGGHENEKKKNDSVAPTDFEKGPDQVNKKAIYNRVVVEEREDGNTYYRTEDGNEFKAPTIPNKYQGEDAWDGSAPTDV